MQDEKFGEHIFRFNKSDNGGESLSLTTRFYDNGDGHKGLSPGLYYTQELTLNSYNNSATFHLHGAILTPEVLRSLADELDKKLIDIKSAGV